ncbi:MAG: hypothetical protein GC166_08890 [Alphaproteobacteria bacterium]|nr:hypothetical protein [Alphaproteobacteria bacterium]
MPPSSDPFVQALRVSPELFPHLFAPGTDSVSIARLTRAGYETASFLDERAFQGVASRVVPFAMVTEAADDLPEACDFIFHIGHVGSTLLARLLGQHPAIHCLREPAILRTLVAMRTDPAQLPRPISESDFDARLTTFLRLWSRTFAPTERALIKATSYVSALAPEIMARPSAPRAILMKVSAETFLATILGAPNSPRELQHYAPSRLRRLQKRSGNVGQPQSMGELVAMSWAAEMASLTEAAKIAGERAMWLDFDDFLTNPSASLAACFAHLNVTASADEITAIAASPDMTRYSKAPEHAYDTKLRDDVLAEARAMHASEIARGLEWLEGNGMAI